MSDSGPNSTDTDQLETDQVFIDTQALVRERFDWQSRTFMRLKELVRSGHVQVLTTSITRSEVRSKIRETLGHARTALRKYEVVLGHLQTSAAVAAVEHNAAEETLQSLFDGFMEEIKAVEVPLSKNVDKIFEDYFLERSPFSAKKKSEFPDAFVITSLQERAKTIGRKIYVVSGDGDMAASCEDASELVSVKSLVDVISMATVTKALHDNLLSFLKGCDRLTDILTGCLLEAKVSLHGASGPNSRFHLVSGSVGSVDEIELTDLQVITQRGNRYQCLVDFSLYAEVWLEVQVEMHHWDGDEYNENFDEFTTSVSHLGYCYAEIDVEFDSRKPESAWFEFVSCDAEIEVDASEMDEFRRYQR